MTKAMNLVNLVLNQSASIDLEGIPLDFVKARVIIVIFNRSV